MFQVSRRHGHYLYGVIQAGITCGVASGIAHAPVFGHAPAPGSFMLSWLVSWVAMLPIVLIAAPAIRRAVDYFTIDDRGHSEGY